MNLFSKFVMVLFAIQLFGFYQLNNLEKNLESNTVIYVVVLANDSYIVGGANPETGFFRSYDDGRSWEHSGWVNIRGFSMSLVPGTDGKEILIASGNGVLKTTNGGKSWRLTTDWRITEVLDIKVNYTDPDIVYIATAYGPHKSNDRGESWRLISGGMDQLFCSALLIDQNNPSTIYLGGEGGLYRTKNRGENWVLHEFAGKGVRAFAQHARTPHVLLVGTERNGIFRSDDGGETWRQINNGIRPGPIYTIAFHPENPQIIYAGGWESGIYKTTNGGESWSRMTQGLEQTTVMSLAVDPESPDMVYAGMYRGGIYNSNDGGKNWTHTGLGIADVWKIIVD